MAQHHIDIYCERLGPGLWAEPLNALTNIAFIVAAVLLVRVLRGEDAPVRRDPAVIALVVLVFLIGIGSGLFHTFAVRWAGLADVIPIVLFILLYLFLALWRLVGLPAWGALLGMIAVLALLMGLPRLFGFGFGTYGVALAAMFLVGGFLAFVRGHPAGSPILITAGVFALSLSLRTADLPLCEMLPMGTHFLWHILNAVVLYRLTRTMIAHGRRLAPSGPRRPAKAET
ncbi:ceramidase domain-containing protein [Pelagibius sp.]|uniref:ceramidase domain-containing protein n=1 Tax=Pelagibius sp. TaxID=1931238 RepID=UPI0026348476|nr:ceramidase domain-containing protein [Pelagibius sp.]